MKPKGVQILLSHLAQFLMSFDNSNRRLRSTLAVQRS